LSRKRNRTRNRPRRPNPAGSSATLRIGKWEVPFRPKIGLLWLLFGIPVFFGLRLIGQAASDDTENVARYFWWAVAMAVILGIIGTFKKSLDD